MKNSLYIPLVTVLFGFAVHFPLTADAQIPEDFESYANTAALSLVWQSGAGTSAISLDNSMPNTGSNAMAVVHSWGLTPNVSVITSYFATAQDFSLATAAVVRIKCSTANIPVDFEFRLLSSSNSIVATTTVPTGTGLGSYTDVTLPLSPGLPGIEDVQSVLMGGLFGFNTSFTMYYDDLELFFPVVDGSVVVTESGGSTDVSESGTTDTVTVNLSSVPASSVTVTPNSASPDIVITPNNQVITVGTGTNPVSFTVAATNDMLIEGFETASFSFTTSSGDGNFDGLSTSNVTANITDNDFLIQPILFNYYRTGDVAKVSIETLDNHQYTLQKNPILPGLDTNWVYQAGPVPGSLFNPLEFTIPITNGPLNFRILAEPAP